MAGITKAQIRSLVTKIYDGAIEEYTKTLFKIAEDIYRSCIKDYYASYTPTVYTRHGNKKGENLYRANKVIIDNEGEIVWRFLPQLLKKYGAKSDIRADVLAAVIGLEDPVASGAGIGDISIEQMMEYGQRGTTERPSGWPQEWITSYPNKYSQLNYWESSEQTIVAILKDFDQNVVSDTQSLKSEFFDKHIYKYLK